MKQLFIILLASFLYACGGGDSTSGGGSDSASGSSDTSLASGGTAAATPAPSSSSSSSGSGTSSSSSSVSSLAGTYVGSASATISVGGGVITESFTEPFTVVIDNNNLATVTVDGSSETVAVNSGSINVNVPFDEVEDNLRCVGTLQIALSVGSTAISGTITGGGTCNQEGLQADFVIQNGIIAATRQ